jgi:hypothetical protein
MVQDQNEKLVLWGLVLAIAVDGFSGYVVGIVVMPRKNCIAIYRVS